MRLTPALASLPRKHGQFRVAQGVQSQRSVGTMHMRQNIMLVGLLCALLHGRARAEDVPVQGDEITLEDLLPALRGTELGTIAVAKAPAPGESALVRSSDVRAALRKQGRDTRGLAIPRSVRVVRRARTLAVDELENLVRAELAPKLAPCDVARLSSLAPVRIAEGEFDIQVETAPRVNSGRVHAAITVLQGSRAQRMSAQVELSCPPPVVSAGANVRLVVVSGPVRVSAPGVAHQPGRVGDEIRVTNQISKKGLRGRVLDAQTVEVLP